MKKKVGIVRFLGSNCDADVFWAFEKLGAQTEYLWAGDHFDSKKFDVLILPGGFSYGDYLRAGAIAARTPAMDDVRKATERGAPVLGICNGFQILTEAGLLPGALTKNLSRKFQDEWVPLRASSTRGSWGQKLKPQQLLNLPIAHSMGRFIAPEEILKKLFDQEQVWLEYERNPNGSLKDIAGIMNEKGNVAALMPHPERAMADYLGSQDGQNILESVLS